MAERSNMLKQIQTLEFILLDAALYLDTHPCDEAALAYYHKYKEVLAKAVAEYEACFGPLTAGGVMSKNKWTWIEHPWPWELEA